MKTYEILNALPPESFLNPDNFDTKYDSQAYGLEQYQNGFEIGKESKYVVISANSTWFAKNKNGGSTHSYEGIGYHANTKDLLRGFLDSGCKVIVYRLTDKGITKTTIKE